MNRKVCRPEIAFFLCLVISVLNSIPAFAAFGDLRVFDKNYTIKYEITGGGNRVNNISAEADNATLLVNVVSQSNGRLSIELPRNIIDSKKAGNIDDRYIVFQDGQVTNTEEIKTDSQARTLAIDFNKGIGQIEISGSKILPEFGAVSALVLAISTAAMIAARSKLHKS